MFWIIAIFLILLGILFYLLYRIDARDYWRRLKGNFKPSSRPEIYSEVSREGILDKDKVISYTLYGNYQKYLPNLLLNLEMIREQMPDWGTRVYVSVNIPKKAINQMTSRGAQVIVMGPNEPQGHEGALWRFLPGAENLTFVSLDADDSFDKKEVIETWYNSGKQFGLFNPNQFLLPITAGTTGARAGSLLDIKTKIDKYSETWFGFDEAFLNLEIWPRVQQMGYWKIPGIPWTGLFFGLIALIAILALILVARWLAVR